MARRRTPPKRNFLFLIWGPFFIGIAAINSPTFTWTPPGKTGGDKRVRLVAQQSPFCTCQIDRTRPEYSIVLLQTVVG